MCRPLESKLMFKYEWRVTLCGSLAYTFPFGEDRCVCVCSPPIHPSKCYPLKQFISDAPEKICRVGRQSAISNTLLR